MKEGMFYVLRRMTRRDGFFPKFKWEMEMQEMDLKYKKSTVSEGKDKGGALD